MRLRHFLFLTITIFAFTSSIPDIQGQGTENQQESEPAPPAITIKVDKETYANGDTIVVSGSIRSVVEGTPVTIQILDPGNNIVYVDQLEVSTDGRYTTSITAGGPKWKQDGQYTVKSQYGIEKVSTDTVFDFKETPTEPVTELFEVDADQKGTYDVEYTIQGGSVKDIVIDFEGLALVVKLNATNNGFVSLDLPREMMDAKTPTGNDESFIVLIDGNQVDHEPISKSDDVRKINVPFLEGDSEVRIIGTFIVPEFGLFTLIVLAASLSSIIVLYPLVFKQKITPKY